MGFFFTHDDIQKIVNRTKTVTRRVYKDYWEVRGVAYREFDARDNENDPVEAVVAAPIDASPNRGAVPYQHRTKWRVGNDYAVQPGRGQPGVWWHPATCHWVTPHGSVYEAEYRAFWQPLRIRLLSILRVPLWDITEEDAVAEGCVPLYVGEFEEVTAVTARDEYRALWGRINGSKSWDANPDVWVLTFSVVK